MDFFLFDGRGILLYFTRPSLCSIIIFTKFSLKRYVYRCREGTRYMKRSETIKLRFMAISFLLLIGFFVGPLRADTKSTSLDSAQLEAISDEVMEVVVPKPTKDSLQYEKPLSFDYLPYAFRTDRYYSIGTAFAISPSEFLSAAHVMNIGEGSQFKEVLLRDKEGKVYFIDKILKYSLNRDFVVFSVRDITVKRFLQVNMNPRLNQKVYAVGNALGQGIVIRDGLYTSSTPEDVAGEWKWIRFSAAASPGNSGGPLLDEDGKVIGIVLRKSPNENLNYAVPIAEVMNAKKNTAVVQTKMKYNLDNMDMTKTTTIKEEISLPKTYGELSREVDRIVRQSYKATLKDFFAENRDAIFPRSPGSTQLFYKNIDATFPHFIMKGKDSNWDTYRPKDMKDAELGNNGHLAYGTVGSIVFLSIQKPDEVSLDKFYGDSKLFMDLVLKGIDLSRQLGPDKNKITSMGNAVEDYTFADSYGRNWMVRTWLSEYNDKKIVVFSLPVPNGFVVMMKADATGKIDRELIPDLKALSDFIYVSYRGTFKEWREFLSVKKLLPPIFSTLDISPGNNQMLQFKSSRLALSCSSDMMNISDKSELRLDFSYFPERGRTVWDIGRIWVGEDKHHSIGYTVYRNMKPSKELGDQYQSRWKDMTEQRFPYNRSTFYQDRSTIISAMYSRNKSTQKEDTLSGSVLYGVSFVKQGIVDQKEMETKLEMFMRNLIIYEGNSVYPERSEK
jgi:serine protease Do